MFIQIDVHVNKKKFLFFRSDFNKNEIQYEFRINGGCGFSLRKDMVEMVCQSNKKKKQCIKNEIHILCGFIFASKILKNVYLILMNSRY